MQKETDIGKGSSEEKFLGKNGMKLTAERVLLPDPILCDLLRRQKRVLFVEGNHARIYERRNNEESRAQENEEPTGSVWRVFHMRKTLI
jgi:hypothetical protein